MSDNTEQKSTGSGAPIDVTAPRKMPYSERMERAVLSAMLRSPQEYMGMAASIFKEDSKPFYRPAYREIYQVLCELATEGSSEIDIVSVAQKLQEHGKLDAIGGEAALLELEMDAPNTVNFETWCKTLQKYAILRRMIEVCTSALMKCYDGENDTDVDELVNSIETDVFSVRGQEERSAVKPIKAVMFDVMKELEEIWEGTKTVGIKTGFKLLDDYTKGLKPGEMFVLAARPGIGKTALALNIIRNVALNKKEDEEPKKIVIFSQEMSAEQIGRRLLATESKISEGVFTSKSLDKDYIRQLENAVRNYSKTQIFVDPTGGLYISELRAKAMQLKHAHGLDLIVIDYLQLMHASVGRNDNRQNEVSMVSGGIKKLAKDLNIPILVLAQLNREADANNSVPRLANLRESGSIEQDADIVTFLHRNRDDSKDLQENQFVEADWIIEKNRNGATGRVKLHFFPARFEFIAAAPYNESYAPQSSGQNK